MVNIQKCAVIGCGFVGASIAFSLAEGGLFSELVLIDSNKEKAEGEAMDISHGIPLFKPAEIYAGDYSDLADCSLIIITAGTSQKPNETRLDLVHRNVDIMKDIVSNIIKYNTEAILLVVSNPVDILTYVAMKCSGFPKSRVIGSGTVLDTARLKYMIGKHLGVDSRSVHAFIIGEHGDSELAVWSSANVSGVKLSGFCNACGKCVERENMMKIYDDVVNSAYHVIERKGATYYAIAAAVRRIAECIVRDEHSIMPISCYVAGHYGLSDICLGVPAIVGRNGAEQVLDIELDDNEKALLLNSAKTLKNILNGIEGIE